MNPCGGHCEPGGGGGGVGGGGIPITDYMGGSAQKGYLFKDGSI